MGSFPLNTVLWNRISIQIWQVSDPVSSPNPLSSREAGRDKILLLRYPQIQVLPLQKLKRILHHIPSDVPLQLLILLDVSPSHEISHIRQSFDLVIGVASKHLLVDHSILQGYLLQQRPVVVKERVELLLVFEVEVLGEQSFAEITGVPRNLDQDSIDQSHLSAVVSADYTDFRVSLPPHRPIIDVGRPYYHILIINYHELRVHIDYLSDGLVGARKSTMGPEPEEPDVSLGVRDEVPELIEQRVLPSGDGLVLPMHLEFQDFGVGVIHLPSESREKREYHVHSELLVVLLRFLDSQGDGVPYLVLHDVGVSAGRDEELVLDVNVVLRVGNQLHIRHLNRTFSGLFGATN